MANGWSKNCSDWLVGVQPSRKRAVKAFRRSRARCDGKRELAEREAEAEDLIFDAKCVLVYSSGIWSREVTTFQPR